MYKKQFFPPLCMLLLLSACNAPQTCCDTPPSIAQSAAGEVAATNLRIDTAQVITGAEGRFTLTATVDHPGPDDCSGKTTLIVLLPVESRVLSFSATDQNGNVLPMFKSGGYEGYLYTCLPEGICPGGNTTSVLRVTLSVEAIVPPGSQTSGKEQFAVMAYGTVPDADVSNNFWYWKKPTP